MLKSIATVSLSGTLPEKLEAAAAIGFDGVDIFKTDLLTFEGLPEDIRDLANGLGLTITCFQPFRDFEAMPEPQRSRNLDRAERKFDVMQALGTDLLLVCSNVHAAAIDDDARAAADFHALAERAQKRGLRIGYEALAWGRHVNRWRHAYKIVQTANHPNLGPLWGAIAFILLEDRLSAITESWWLMFAPIVIIFALASPEGIQGLVFRLRGRDDWTLTRSGIPPRPATIAPFHGSSQKLDPSKPMLSVTGLHKRFGSLVVATDISLEVYPYKLHSFIGPNGAGKTTFFNMMTGIL